MRLSLSYSLARGGRYGGGVRWERTWAGGSGIVSQARGASAACASRACFCVGGLSWHMAAGGDAAVSKR